jgi:hypothetical protein
MIDAAGEELIDANETAYRLGLRNARAVLDLRVHRLGFPPPVCRQGRVLLWSWPQVELWSQEAGRAVRPVEHPGLRHLDIPA